MYRKNIIVCVLVLLAASMQLSAQADRREVRAGNRKFRKEDYKEAEIYYRKAAVKDSLSVAAQYNLASALYRQGDYDGAAKALDTVKDVADGADYFFNRGDVALQKEDYAGAVEAFKQALLRNPGDMAAKENYVYAKKKLEDQQQNGGDQQQGDDNQQNDGNDDRQQDNGQDNKDNKDNQNGNQDEPQQDGRQPDNGDGRQDQRDGQSEPREGQISPQQAQQMLQAIQAKEKDTQDKVNKEKARALKSRQKDKNW